MSSGSSIFLVATSQFSSALGSRYRARAPGLLRQISKALQSTSNMTVDINGECSAITLAQPLCLSLRLTTLHAASYRYVQIPHSDNLGSVYPTHQHSGAQQSLTRMRLIRIYPGQPASHRVPFVRLTSKMHANLGLVD
ncbi:hypothetical protein CC80DRAFT_246417 [Byssothecium circinans]|uniref:Uncharacterized protein n=1 Tax=Byssothecium circinans TaxID=147558 RepID=A0A6A5TBI8_9PLEO|nr:hypothetical protein CC80DRAFT_246417 [Byssothecium circinans]